MIEVFFAQTIRLISPGYSPHYYRFHGLISDWLYLERGKRSPFTEAMFFRNINTNTGFFACFLRWCVWAACQHTAPPKDTWIDWLLTSSEKWSFLKLCFPEMVPVFWSHFHEQFKLNISQSNLQNVFWFKSQK